MTSVKGKVAFITGGAQGVGAEVARRLHAMGAQLVLVDLDGAALAAIHAELGGDENVLTAVADVRDFPAMQSVADRAVVHFGGIDIVLANAGIADLASVLTVDPEDFRRTMDVNVLGVFHTVRAALPSIIARRGYVLMVSSSAAFVFGPGLAPYHASKAAVEHLANAVRLEVAHLGVAVGSAHMHWIETAMVRGFAEKTAFGEMLDALPWPIGVTTPLPKCGAAFVKGIEHRKRRVYCPRWVGLMRWLRPVASTRLGELPLRKITPGLLDLLDAQTAAQGRPFGDRTEPLERTHEKP